MEITWYGQSCFRLRSKGLAVVTDPYNPEIGLKLPRLAATIITVSHDQPDHNHVTAVKSGAFVISGPGEYEVQGIFVLGIATPGETKEGQQSIRNTAYRIEFEDLSICHLGDLAQIPNQEQIELLTGADILLVPVGGHSTLSAAQAAEVVNLLEPSIVIPMHYKIPGLAPLLDMPKRFLNELSVEQPEMLETLSITRAELGSDTEAPMRVVLLEPKQ
jgi:L-ascorbate metabolism protein UlaG (beta-lactamase superfamily)